LAVFTQPFQIDMPIFFIKKDIFPPISTLGDVMGYIRKNSSCKSWHG
jgi:hypothetical protein